MNEPLTTRGTSEDVIRSQYFTIIKNKELPTKLTKFKRYVIRNAKTTDLFVAYKESLEEIYKFGPKNMMEQFVRVGVEIGYLYRVKRKEYEVMNLEDYEENEYFKVNGIIYIKLLR